MRTPALKIESLEKRYETGVVALQGVSIEIGEGGGAADPTGGAGDQTAAAQEARDRRPAAGHHPSRSRGASGWTRSEDSVIASIS